jgi:hypothetical protein
MKIRIHCVLVSDIEPEPHHDGGAVSSLRVLCYYDKAHSFFWNNLV